MTCNCKICVYGREVQAHLAKIPNEVLRKFFEELYEKMCNIDMNLNHAQCVIEGSWPTADDYISFARMKRAMHASAPTGLKCADCQVDEKPCPNCFGAWEAQHDIHTSTRMLPNSGPTKVSVPDLYFPGHRIIGFRIPNPGLGETLAGQLDYIAYKP